MSLISLPIKDQGGNTYYLTYKEMHDMHENNELKAGDIVYINDTFSDIWYDCEDQYTYMTFDSMDEYRTAPWGYDAGYSQDLTDEYQQGDHVIIKVELEQELNYQGVPDIIEYEHFIRYNKMGQRLIFGKFIFDFFKK